jgi:hypothetical protein
VIFATIWCGLRGRPKDVQRATLQPAAVAIFLMSALCSERRRAMTGILAAQSAEMRAKAETMLQRGAGGRIARHNPSVVAFKDQER